MGSETGCGITCRFEVFHICLGSMEGRGDATLSLDHGLARRKADRVMSWVGAKASRHVSSTAPSVIRYVSQRAHQAVDHHRTALHSTCIVLKVCATLNMRLIILDYHVLRGSTDVAICSHAQLRRDYSILIHGER